MGLSFVFASTVTACIFASGATFGSATSVTVILTVAADESTVPSFTVKVKLSDP